MSESKNSHRLIMVGIFKRSSAFMFDWIFFIFAGNEDMRDSLDEFEFCKFATELRPLIDVGI